MSKQSNQRYRKEKEKEHLKKEGLGQAAGNAESHQGREKINTEYKTSSNPSDH